MLKALYDAANKATDEAHEASASDAICDEDDDESMTASSEMSRARTFESLVVVVSSLRRYSRTFESLVIVVSLFWRFGVVLEPLSRSCLSSRRFCVGGFL
jgi:hypothetical protein